MASAFTENQTSLSLKCRKCRYLLLEQPPNEIAESSSQANSEEDYQEASNTFNICDDNLPQWIADAVEEVRQIIQIVLVQDNIISREAGPKVN